MTKKKDLYIGEDTARTVDCTRETYRFCREQLDRLGLDRRRGLDIGTNQGLGVRPEDWSDCQLTISDYRREYVTRAKRNLPDIPAVVLDGTRLPLPSKSLGFVMIHQVIEHLKPEDQQHALNEITRVLIPKGIAFVSTPNADSRPKGSRPYSPDHKHELSQAEFLTLLHNRFESVCISQGHLRHSSVFN